MLRRREALPIQAHPAPLCSGGVTHAHIGPEDNLAVPGSNPRFLIKARELAVDEVFIDLEDAVAPAEKAQSRSAVAQSLRDGGWRTKTGQSG